MTWLRQKLSQIQRQVLLTVTREYCTGGRQKKTTLALIREYCTQITTVLEIIADMSQLEQECNQEKSWFEFESGKRINERNKKENSKYDFDFINFDWKLTKEASIG